MTDYGYQRRSLGRFPAEDIAPRWPTWRGPGGRYVTGTTPAVDGGYTS
ncbi:hypothetical protein [Nocardia sp. NBC_00403]